MQSVIIRIDRLTSFLECAMVKLNFERYGNPERRELYEPENEIHSFAELLIAIGGGR